MTSMFEMVVSCITKESKDRTAEEIEALLPWLKKRSNFLESLSTDVLSEIVKNCSFSERVRDDIIIRQGDKGDCFYVILSGKVSVLINTEAVPDDPEEATIVVTEDKYTNDGKTKKDLDRSRYGKFIVAFEAGKSFGELALINKDNIRNASIIADEKTHLLVVNRDLYNRSLKEVHQKEFNQRISFVNNSELFTNWLLRYKRQAAFSLRKEKIGFNMPLVIQGEPTNGLTFILKGQAKIVINPHMHPYQYPSLNLGNFEDNVKHLDSGDTERFTENDTKKTLQIQNSKRLEYSKAEQRLSQKNTEICIVTEGEVIGDLEQGLDLNTYAQSVITIEPTEVYILDAKNFERLINPKRNPRTLRLLRRKAISKLRHRVSRSELRPIPFYCKLNNIILKDEEKVAKESMKKAEATELMKLNERNVTEFFVHRGPLINMYGPGSVFFRNRQMRKDKKQAEEKRKNAARTFKRISKDVPTITVSFPTLRQNDEDSESIESDIEVNNSLDKITKQPLKVFEATTTVEQITDWETASEHLKSIEERLKHWLLSISSLTNERLSASSSKGELYTTLKRFRPEESERRIIPGKKIFLHPKRTNKRQIKTPDDDSRKDVFITATKTKTALVRSSTETMKNSEENAVDEKGTPKVFPDISVPSKLQKKTKPEIKHLITTHQYTPDEYKQLKLLLKKKENEMKVFQTALAI